MHKGIYFTIENQNRKVIAVSKSSELHRLFFIDGDKRKRLSKENGYPLRNLFVNIDGTDYQINLKR